MGTTAGITGSNPKPMVSDSDLTVRTPVRSLTTLIDNVTFNNVKQREQSAIVWCPQYAHLMFYIDLSAEGPADAGIEMQIYIQAYDGVHWHDIIDPVYGTWSYDHDDVVNSSRPSAGLIRESHALPALSLLSADRIRVAVDSLETTATKTFTLTVQVHAIP